MSRNKLRERDDILIVDDKPANLRLLSKMLTDQGYEVRAVTSGSGALKSIQLSKPSLILLDIKMAEMDGYQVCEQLKANARTQDIPVIFISALDDIQDKLKAFQVGGVDYITKPFQVEEVLARTKNHLRLQKLQKQLVDANMKFERELQLAGKVQASFLPKDMPNVPGWQFSAKLLPARETSGDFLDIFSLPDEKLGVLVADVVDKGVGAALFMVLSWSLIRTYAGIYPTQPERVISLVNQRILEDTLGEQFVTVFYGVLELKSGRFVYCNAGHPPALLLNETSKGTQDLLKTTGSALGIFEESEWYQREIEISPGDHLVLYSDGIPDSQNENGVFFDRERLLISARKHLKETAEEICNGIITDVMDYISDAEQSDDIALVILQRNPQ